MTDRLPENTRLENLSDLVTTMKFSNQISSKLIQALTTTFPAQSPTGIATGIINSTAGGTQIKIGAGYLMSAAVVVNSTGASGAFYDSDSPANVGSSLTIALIPSSGITVNYAMPFKTGLVAQPSSSNLHQIAVSYI